MWYSNQVCKYLSIYEHLWAYMSLFYFHVKHSDTFPSISTCYNSHLVSSPLAARSQGQPLKLVACSLQRRPTASSFLTYSELSIPHSEMLLFGVCCLTSSRLNSQCHICHCRKHRNQVSLSLSLQTPNWHSSHCKCAADKSLPSQSTQEAPTCRTHRNALVNALVSPKQHFFTPNATLEHSTSIEKSLLLPNTPRNMLLLSVASQTVASWSLARNHRISNNAKVFPDM